MKSTRILCFLDKDYGRDVEILLPIVYAAENYFNAKVEFAHNWFGHEIFRKKPDLVLVPNSIGSNLFFDLCAYCKELNIPVFAHISEGNFRTNGTFNYWGYNTHKVFYEEFICHWSQRTLNFLSHEVPQYVDKMVLTGATGFDRYKIYEFESKASFLARYNLSKYKKVIGYAGWAFGKLGTEQGRSEIKFLHKNDPNRLKWMEDQMYFVENVLKQAIENNPDTLFILKRHPNEVNPTITYEVQNEMNRLKEYDNVLYIIDGEDVHTLISASDIWLGFETTTVIEAWLMKYIPTILINQDPNFVRANVHHGCTIAHNYSELQSFINEFYESGNVQAFDSTELEQKREAVMADTIGFWDGLNHLRSAYYLGKAIEKAHQTTPNWHINTVWFIKYWLFQLGRLVYNKQIFLKLPILKKHVFIFDNFKLQGLKALQTKYYGYLNEFYKRNNLDEQVKNGSIWTQILQKAIKTI